jgi:hypothetical protein
MCQRALTARSNLAAGDDGEKKVALLAFYFEYSTQIASLVIVCLVMAIFLFAFAVSLTSALKMHTSTLTIVLPLAPLVVLLLSLTWFALAQGYLPTKLTPAFLSERVSGGMTLWVDKTCVDQSNVAGFLNQGIDHFMMRCDRMMAFPSTSCARTKFLQEATSNVSCVPTRHGHEGRRCACATRARRLYASMVHV